MKSERLLRIICRTVVSTRLDKIRRRKYTSEWMQAHTDGECSAAHRILYVALMHATDRERKQCGRFMREDLADLKAQYARIAA